MLLLATKVWEQRKLGEILSDLYNGQTPSRNVKEYWKGDIPWLTSGELNHGIVKETVEKISESGKRAANLRLVPSGTIVIAITGLEAPGTRGNCAILGTDTTINQSVMALFVKDNIDTQFIFQWYKKIGQEYGIKYTQGTKQQSYNYDIVKILPIGIPTATEEQKKIGKLLNCFSALIALYERKTRLLGKLRTFLTQRLFSNSSKVSLYFDNKNWSKHKISEFLTERNEKVVPNSSIPLVSFTVEKGVTPKSKRYNREFLVKDDNKKYKITKKDDIVYNPANLKFGAIARNKFGNAAFSPIYVTFITKLNPAFTEFLVCRKDFINLALKYQEGTVYERMAVKSKDFLNLKIYLPNSSRDINHIAQILQSLDTLVSLNKNKVSLITLIKKELLNTMFI